ncbi:MAG: cyclic nucleotide-binding domain-containing protein [Chitinispirillaceae bacterium]|nr:cyclic nucleotide-binding domain-containing protein [Chitinispirillaceae bacterium]
MMHGSGVSSAIKGGAARKTVARPERLCKRGSLLYIEGEPGTDMFVVRSGKIRLLKHEGETAVVIDTAGPGSVIGEMSLLRREPRTATAQVVEDSVVVPVDEETYAATIANIPSWLGGALRSLVKRLVDTLAQSGTETVRRGVAGVIRVLLLCVEDLGKNKDREALVPLGPLKETLYNLTGLGDAELENIFMHLILKKMIGIVRDDSGGESVRINNRKVLSLYLEFLRSRRENGSFPGENLPLAAYDHAGFILTSEGLTRGADRSGRIAVTMEAFDNEWRLKGKETPVEKDALKAIAEAGTGDAGGPFIFNLDNLRRLHLTGTWLPVFKEDVKL